MFSDVEVFIRKAIQRKYPEHQYVLPLSYEIERHAYSPRFLGEETYAKGQSRDYLIDERPTWCIDPLDGMFHVAL